MPAQRGVAKPQPDARCLLLACPCRLGGSITAALFLKQYVKEEVAWSHIDMAGPVWDEKTGIPTGFGATTLAEWVLAQ